MPNGTQKFRDLKPGNTGSQSMIGLTKLCQIVPKERMARTRDEVAPLAIRSPCDPARTHQRLGKPPFSW